MALQHSVRAFLLGGWNKRGVENDMLINRFQLEQILSGGEKNNVRKFIDFRFLTEADVGNGSLTSDGQYLYICTRVGLLKID